MHVYSSEKNLIEGMCSAVRKQKVRSSRTLIVNLVQIIRGKSHISLVILANAVEETNESMHLNLNLVNTSKKEKCWAITGGFN